MSDQRSVGELLAAAQTRLENDIRDGNPGTRQWARAQLTKLDTHGTTDGHLGSPCVADGEPFPCSTIAYLLAAD
ncbi:hypothetical protein SAMN05443575_1341 [Jatrophihabitans endophyticus]|uniref:Uncharacterized protein n=1 Tax=Jatrophihabitans endophyticus TaxID=1206085 RepID=A0A1M5GZ71_9ACTN|nr:hypothetical protein [Jatrophihabitans endophyticus]SHG09049.1 hypothetical protein SAMN05443575_1341 [Jatrophihabitans endophyticus]